MADITGSTVYVLGAGASHHTGAPLLGNFLVKARLLHEGTALKNPEAFDRVFSWIDGLRPSSYYVETDLDNLEHVFSLAELGQQLGRAEETQIFTDLRFIIMETLDSCQIKVESKRFQPDAVYRQFVEELVTYNQQRNERLRQNFRPDSVITFNYDIALDYAMSFLGHGPQYHHSAKPGDGFSLLKLHGSLNWAQCRNCNKDNTKPPDLQIVDLSPIPKGHQLTRMLFDDDNFEMPFAMATNVLPKTSCSQCGQALTLEPVLIPPTWSKAIRQSPFAKIWAAAVERLKTAFQIVVVGYSLPPTDTFFQYLLTLGLSTNPALNRVVVVDLDGSQEFKSRYRRVFARSLDDRGRLLFQPGTFEDFVHFHMGPVMTKADWRPAG